jgi:hypothetical protein
MTPYAVEQLFFRDNAVSTGEQMREHIEYLRFDT